MRQSMNRREFLRTSTLAAGTTGLTLGGCANGPAATAQPVAAAQQPAKAFAYQDGLSPWPICIDTFTIRPASLTEKIHIAHETGWDGLEIWESELREYEENGGDLPQLGRRISELGLQVPNVIALWQAFPQTDEAFENNLPTQRERMRQARDIGAKHIQVVGAPARPWQQFDLQQAARHYRRYLEIGIQDYNVKPAVMFLQFLPHIQRLGQASAIAMDADHPEAKIIPDVFHLYRGRSGFAGLKHIKGSFIAVFQINDVPADPPRDQLEDEHRIFPGDGILPLEEALQDIHANGFDGAVTLQLFDRQLWERNLKDVAEEGRDKTVAVVAKAMGRG